MGWRLFFLGLLILGSIAVVLPIVYNLGLQLKPEQVDAARERWAEHGRRDYDLKIQRRIDTEEQADEFFIQVRGGKVSTGRCNGEPLDPTESSRYMVEGLLDHIATTLKDDMKSSGRRNYAMADFDSRDGHPRRYVRRVSGTKERVEWIIKLEDPAPPEK